MTTTATPGWGRSYLSPVSAAEVTADRTGVQETLNRYAFALDQHDLTALGEVLTEDVTWTFTVAGIVHLEPISGRDAVLDFVRQSMAAQTDQGRHHLTNVIVYGAEGNTIKAQAYLLQTANVITTGFYSFELRQVEQQWRIATLFLGLDNDQE